MIGRGTFRQQRGLVESLKNIGWCIGQAELGLAVVGEVVSLEKQLRWFDTTSVACPDSMNQGEPVQTIPSSY